MHVDVPCGCSWTTPADVTLRCRWILFRLRRCTQRSFYFSFTYESAKSNIIRVAFLSGLLLLDGRVYVGLQFANGKYLGI